MNSDHTISQNSGIRKLIGSYPVSSMKGRPPEKPGRLLMIDCGATKLATAKKQTTHNHIVLMLLLEMVNWVYFNVRLLIYIVSAGC